MNINNVVCKICGNISHEFASAKILKQYTITYFKCTNCHFIQTETPYWLDEAYSSAITSGDVGLVQRNIQLSVITSQLIRFGFNDCTDFVDYGGGHGLFTRLMRDKGDNFFWVDKYAENLFARGFEVESNHHYGLVTAFELFEHLVDPLPEIEQILKFSDSIFFSTLLLPKNHPHPNDWWYYNLDFGQHIAIYTYQSLQHIAKMFNLRLYSNKTSLHLLTNRKINPIVYSVILRYRFAHVLMLLQARKSLILSDYTLITGNEIK